MTTLGALVGSLGHKAYTLDSGVALLLPHYDGFIALYLRLLRVVYTAV